MACRALGVASSDHRTACSSAPLVCAHTRAALDKWCRVTRAWGCRTSMAMEDSHPEDIMPDFDDDDDDDDDDFGQAM